MVRLGLLMTTYNEESNIQRCLESIKPYLDYYCIGVDVKTTDNTKGKVLEVMGDVKAVSYTHLTLPTILRV